MRFELGLLLICAQVLVQVNAVPAAQVTNPTSPVILNPKVEYSLADLERLHTAERLSDKSSTKAHRVVESRAAVLPEVDLKVAVKDSVFQLQKAAISYISRCPYEGHEIEEFMVEVSYDGKYMYFANRQNIDGFGIATSGGGYGNPILGNVKFHHSVCRSPSPHKVCTYYYSGTITVSLVAIGDNRHISVDAKHPNSQPPDYAARLVETCIPSPTNGKKVVCPASRDIPENSCTIDHVYPANKY